MSPDYSAKQSRGTRLAKYIARSGYCSRREAERRIVLGEVSLNGEITCDVTVCVDEDAEIRVKGVLLQLVTKARLWRFHKPIGCLVTHHDPQNRPIIFDFLPKNLPRLMTVGRLDMNSEGLLLLSNDGNTTTMLERPGTKRCYRVRCHGVMDHAKIKKIEKGVVIEGIKYRPVGVVCEGSKAKRHWFSLSLTEGKNREIRHLMAYAGLNVTRLIRVSYGPFTLGTLKKGEIKEVPEDAFKQWRACL
jgi:23S rRNA pseudouridine2605 synthase